MMVMAMISSSRVTPRCVRDLVIPSILINPRSLLHTYGGLRTHNLKRLVLAVAGAGRGYGNHSRAFGLGHKHQVKHDAISGNTQGTRWTLRGYLQRAGLRIVAMNQGYWLSVFAQKVSVGDVHELHHLGIVGDLNRHRSHVLASGQCYVDCE